MRIRQFVESFGIRDFQTVSRSRVLVWRLFVAVASAMAMLMGVLMPAASGASVDPEVSSGSGMSEVASVETGKSPNAMLLASDGKTLYVTNGEETNHGSDTTVTVIDMLEGVSATIDTQVSNPTRPGLSANGETLVVQSGAGTNQLSLIDTRTRAVLASRPTPKLVYYVMSPDASHIVGVFADASGRKVNEFAAITVGATSDEPLEMLRLQANFLTPVALSPDGRNLYGILLRDGQSRWVCIDSATGDVTKDYGLIPVNLVGGFTAFYDGDTMRLPVIEGSVTRLLSVAAGNGDIIQDTSIPFVAHAVSTTPDGSTTLVAGDDGQGVLVYANGDAVRKIGRPICVRSSFCALSPDGSVIYSADADNARLIATDTRDDSVDVLRTDAARCTSMAVSHDGTRLAFLDDALAQPGRIILVATGRTIDTGNDDTRDTGDTGKDDTGGIADEEGTPPPAVSEMNALSWARSHPAATAGIMAAVMVLLATVTLMVIRHHGQHLHQPQHHRH